MTCPNIADCRQLSSGVLSGRHRRGEAYALNDPEESVIRGRLAATGLDARAIFEALSTISNLFGPAVAANDTVRDCVVMLLASMLEDGMATAARRWSVTF